LADRRRTRRHDHRSRHRAAQRESSGVNTAPHLEIRGLSKTFGANRALRGTGLTVAPDEIHGLVGENGSGKSTLVKLLSGYHRPDPGGAVLMDGSQMGLPIAPDEMRRRGLA